MIIDPASVFRKYIQKSLQSVFLVDNKGFDRFMITSQLSYSGKIISHRSLSNMNVRKNRNVGNPVTHPETQNRADTFHQQTYPQCDNEPESVERAHMDLISRSML